MTSPINILAQLNFGSASAISENIDEQLRNHLYVETQLDTKLLKEIEEDKYDLVLISGNAGDGKTAFLKQLENKTNMVTKSGKQIVIDFDATESSSPLETQAQKLTGLLADFSDEAFERGTQLQGVYVIAINTGMIMHFFNNSEKFSQLREVIIGKLKIKTSDSELSPDANPWKVLLIDLNNRSLINTYNPTINKDSQLNSMYDKIVDKLYDPNNFIWEKCEECTIKDKCFVQFNARSLNNNLVSERLKLLLNFVHFDSEFHVTTRNLLNILSYLTISHYSYYYTKNFCDQINKEVSELLSFKSLLDNGTLNFLSSEKGVIYKKTLNHLANFTQKLYYNLAMNDQELFSEVKLLNNTSYELGGQLIKLLNGENFINDFANRSNQKVDNISSDIFFNLDSILLGHTEMEFAPFESFVFEIYGKVLEQIKIELSTMATDVNEDIENEILDELKKISLQLFKVLKRREFFTNQKLEIGDLSRYNYFSEYVELIEKMSRLSTPEGEEDDDLFDDINEQIYTKISAYLRKIIHKHQGLQNWEDESNSFYLIKDKNTDRSLYRAYQEAEFNIGPEPSFEPSQSIYMDTLLRYLTLNVNDGLVTFTVNLGFYEYLRSISIGYEPMESELQSFSQVKILVEALKKVPVNVKNMNELFIMDDSMKENYKVYYRTALNRKLLW